LLEASAEGIPVYWFNRGTGDQRETVMFDGDPLSPANRALIEKTQLDAISRGCSRGTGPEVQDEDIVRAMMVVRANAMTYNAPSPQLAQMLLELLNRRITPVVQSRGTLGEGDLAQLANVGAAMVGAGEVYYQGVRMPRGGAEARGSCPYSPLPPMTMRSPAAMPMRPDRPRWWCMTREHAFEWCDVLYAIDLNGMNSSITPLERRRAARSSRSLAQLARDTRLGNAAGKLSVRQRCSRIIQDPESLRPLPFARVQPGRRGPNCATPCCCRPTPRTIIPRSM
jgi:histidine ammonia-lyase